MAPASAQNKILLVNGEVTLQYLRALMLRMKGYDVDSTTTLEEAKNKIAEDDYRLVIVDVGYFAEPGLLFCEEIKTKYPKIKVLLQSDNQLYLSPSSCPDKVVSKQDGPHSFISEVEAMLEAGQELA